jgi:microcystin-dependent protein
MVAVTHTKVSAVSDGADTTFIRPGDWNAQHSVQVSTTDRVIGRQSASGGAAEEIPCTALGRSILASSTLAALIAAGIPLSTTGDMKPTIKTVADTGWAMLDDGTIGNDTSGATNLASTALAVALYTLVWTNIPNTLAPIQDSTGAPTTRGASAAADFAASKRLSLPKVLGRVLGAAGTGVGLTARALGAQVGEEAHTIAATELPAHHHSVYLHDVGHTHVEGFGNLGGGLTTMATNAAGAGNAPSSNATLPAQAALTIQSAADSGTYPSNTPNGTANQTADSAAPTVTTNVMQPSAFVNWMIKL